MKSLFIFLIVALSTGVLIAQKTKTLNGRVISEDLEPIPKATINDVDTTAFGLTNSDGYFDIEVPVETSKLILGFIGMEWVLVKIKDDCQNLEIVMMTDVIYDFIPTKKINRKRHKRFKQLPKKHQIAFEQGVFKSREPCICYVFTK